MSYTLYKTVSGFDKALTTVQYALSTKADATATAWTTTGVTEVTTLRSTTKGVYGVTITAADNFEGVIGWRDSTAAGAKYAWEEIIPHQWEWIEDIKNSVPAGGGPIQAIYPVTDPNGLALPGASVNCTSDIAGATIIARAVTNSDGNAIFYLDAGTYYFWVYHSSYEFVNPDTEVVS